MNPDQYLVVAWLRPIDLPQRKHLSRFAVPFLDQRPHLQLAVVDDIRAVLCVWSRCVPTSNRPDVIDLTPYWPTEGVETRLVLAEAVATPVAHFHAYHTITEVAAISITLKKV